VTSPTDRGPTLTDGADTTQPAAGGTILLSSNRHDGPVSTVLHDGLVFDVSVEGPADGTPVLLLHGFPQRASSWGPVAARLHAAGMRTIAPDQRGYSPGARPPGRRAYRAGTLVDDAVAVVDALGGGPVHVVGHDWGAVVAWALAARHPERVRTVTGVSVPPPAAYLRSLLTSRQGLASWYTYLFQLPGLPERVIGDPDRCAALLRRTGQNPEQARRDAEAIAEFPTGPLNWYRAIPLEVRSVLTEAPVRVPAMFVWSDGDAAITRQAGESAHRHVEAPFRYAELRGVSHWIPDEAPAALADLVLDHVA
jgi:pimeloyl-ACP methyl ester carboxylesterase